MKKSSPFRSFFEFTISEIKGIGFFMLVIGLISAYQYYPIFHKFPKSVEVQLLELIKIHEFGSNDLSKRSEVLQWHLRPFNPNKTKAIEFREMGFSNQFISNFFKYRSQHGYINSIEEFLSVDGLSIEDQNRIKPFINLEWENSYPALDQNLAQTKDKKTKHEPDSPQTFDINKVDAEQLIVVNGIGSVLAGRIIKFRDRLGGFYQANQLYEVYGLDSLVVKNLLKYSNGFGSVNKLKINQLTVKELASHPYIDYGFAKKIVSYRTQHGPFIHQDDLLKIYGIDKNWMDRLLPYLYLE